jgi:hypothetical protein
VEVWHVPNRHWRHHYEGEPPRWADKDHHHDRDDYVVHDRGRGHKHDDD